jgi:hypothetical protein
VTSHFLCVIKHIKYFITLFNLIIMKIKAIAAIVALFFATSTFAQVAEPTTTTSTTIPAKGQAQTPANNGGTAKPNGNGKMKHAEGEHHDNGQHKGDKNHTPGNKNANGQANSNGKAKHAEGDHKEGDYKGGKANPNGKARHEEGENHEGHGDKGKMKPAEGTATQPGTIEKKTMKAKKKAN